MASLKDKWKSFKAKHPAFEKSKNFKSDVGPQLDKFDKARDEYSAMKVAMREALKKKSNEVFVIGQSVGAALKGYEAVLNELAATDKTIAADFKAAEFDRFVDIYVKQYKEQ
jgi:hypothetical protein